MASFSRRNGNSPFTFTTIFYLLLVFIAPLAFLGTANAADETPSNNSEYGTVIGIDLGTTYS